MLVTCVLIALFLYSVIAVVSVVGVLRYAPEMDSTTISQPRPAVTIVVAARNEEDDIARCIEALLNQSYEGDYEILIVDDESTDQTLPIAAKYTSDIRCRILTTRDSPSSLTGKARPLDTGFRSASFALIATTDADCTPPESWLSSLVDFLVANDSDMVCGCTVVNGKGLAGTVQRIDWLHLLCIAAGLNAAGKPLTAMGNNMLFKKQAYLDLGGYDRMGSTLTEDFHFYRTVAKNNPASVAILPVRSARNITNGEGSFRRMLEQKKRWLVGGFHAPPWVWLLYLTYFIVHAGLISVIAVNPVSGTTMFAAKVVLDSALIASLAHRLKENVPWISFPVFQVYQFAGVILIPILLLLGRRVAWKGRSHPVSQLSSTS